MLFRSIQLKGSGCYKLSRPEFETLFTPDVTKPYFDEMLHSLLREMSRELNYAFDKIYRKYGI